MSKFKTGQRASIINCTMGGKFIVEGSAELLRNLGDGRWLVKFDNGDKVERFVDYAAQRDPAAYAQGLNDRAPAGVSGAALEPVPSADDPMATTIRAAALAHRTGIEVREE